NDINNYGQIVGTIGSGTTGSPYTGYTSVAPYTSFTPVPYPRASGIVVTGLTNTATTPSMAGYVIGPPQLRGTWGAVQISGLWTLIKDRKEGKNAYSVTEILGMNDSSFAVGFYTSTTGSNIPVVLSVPTENFTQLKPPGYTNAEATGINDANHITGWEQTAGGISGFYEQSNTYYTFSYPSSAATEALSINAQNQVVGYYKTSGGAKHGFMLTGPTSGNQQFWQSIDDPNAVNGTFVTGVNDLDDICGYYIDGSGVQHGFIAVPSGSKLARL
ncbi:MAG: hypothetical protein WA814_03390, partial [Candidatus Baltobacteraceae bacterium]